MSRVVAVARMQLINKWAYVGNPLLILGAAFLLSLAIFALVPVDEAKYGGGSQAPLWYFVFLGIQSMTLVFPFSQGLSISRRAFGVLVSTLGTVAILIGIAALSTLYLWWGSIGGWFAQQTPLSISAWTALLCVALAAGSYLTLRRATP
ncbi:hypothetical protein [Arthrobacter cavernae]|uniref:Uncharacterized protein n=1 Tax=Arthrobacter cavernae TaxID=2817681 RepID=A0A939HEM2_9MICC|nr:hypothetical protein [Arthrobacter cavernae]MBO1266958.1 hypothetical protein [Arthrobacter cavernae]